MNDISASLKNAIRTIPDYPKPGIMFRDITTVLKSAALVREALDLMEDHYRGQRIDKVAGIESRGFILGAALAARLGAGFVPIRKRGKLPAPTIAEEYALEYGTDAVEIHLDAISPGQRILLHDDLLATGGTMKAAVRLVERLQGNLVGVSFLIELSFLGGRTKLAPLDVFSLVDYSSE